MIAVIGGIRCCLYVRRGNLRSERAKLRKGFTTLLLVCLRPHRRIISSQALARPCESYAGELSKTAKRRLGGIEAETKVFLSVVFVFVCGFMMVRV